MEGLGCSGFADAKRLAEWRLITERRRRRFDAGGKSAVLAKMREFFGLGVAVLL